MSKDIIDMRDLTLHKRWEVNASRRHKHKKKASNHDVNIMAGSLYYMI